LQGRKDCNVECFIVAFPLLRLSEIEVSGEEGMEGREDCREGKMKGEKEKRRIVMSSAWNYSLECCRSARL